MSKKIISLLALIGFLAWASPALSAKPNFAPELPERDGTYDVPGRPNLKVRVFVHNPRPGKPDKPGKPGPAPAPTCSDPNTNDTVGATGWRLPSAFQYTLNLASVPSSVKGSSLQEIADLASGVWKDAINNKVNISQDPQFTTVSRATLDGENIIAWGRPGNALAVTYTWYSLSTNEVVESDIIMNSKYRWTWGICSNSGYDAQNILTHEMGHWMGLADEYGSAFVDNTMYGYGDTAELKKNTLEEGDIKGVQAIYVSY